ncbi:hypothetical protein CF326_g7363 [Tilletia indica]|nr:hypothetical protein CF326_g7363 [Tilletia indica]
MADTTSTPAPGTSPAVIVKPTNSSPDEIKIRGISDYDNVLLMLKIAARDKRSTELRINKATIVLLEGKHNWELWRKRLAHFLQPVLGGRLWHLMLNHPATSIEAYQIILAESDDTPVSYEEASAIRHSDLVSIGSNLCQTLSDDIVDDINPANDDEYNPVDGQEVWAQLVETYASRDIASLQAAEDDLSGFTLGNRSAREVSRDLKHIFARIYNAGGGQTAEHRKIGAILRCYTDSRFEATRAAIQQNWANNFQYRFDDIIKRFAGEENLAGLVQKTSSDVDGVRALRVQPGATPSQRSVTAAAGPPSSNKHRANHGRRNIKTGAACWWCTHPGHGIGICEKKRRGEPPHPNSHAAAKGWQQESPRNYPAPQYISYPAPQQSPAPYSGARLMVPYQGGMVHATAMHAYAGPSPSHFQQPYLMYPPYADMAHPAPHFGHHAAPSLAHRIGEVPVNTVPSLSLAQRLSDPMSADYVSVRPY